MDRSTGLVTSHRDIDVIVLDVLGTMVDEPSRIRRGLGALLPDVDDARTSELVEVWHRLATILDAA